ncbi:hypothetical protein AMAG_10143 [Allomyces macrogynus ATCC 38327]|uniref:diacylglycerol O-acyltransferase n=1 Tax=Allomyces macrogynus (strain ATCC 38327) TaxID=578462 RepID=A0A0L0SQM4_ALLM3|nr:hypothetical protein, variant [Allomyces macrogynus ATCC 38327]KNE64803.1 hypothetical protein AMAG_10143 [Allomyces macrogynus ATCC 38327]|eukprot:KNE64802.1 hypothetical protein, variant [Allomyces macrogynus ATCC 38327]
MGMFEDLAWPKLPAAMNVDPTAALAAVRSRSPTLPTFPTIKTPRISLAAATAATKDLFQQSAAASSAATTAAKDLFQLQSAAAKNLLEERSAAAKDLFQQSAAPLLASSPVQQLVHQPVFSSVPVTSIFSALESVTPASLNPGTVPIVENAHDDESITLDDASSRNHSIFDSAAPSTEPAGPPSESTSAPAPALPARAPLRIDTSVARFEPAENGDGPAPATSATVVNAPASPATVANAPAQVGLAEDVSLNEPKELIPALDAPTHDAASVEDRCAVISAEPAPEDDAPVQARLVVVEAPVEIDHADVDVPDQDELALLHALAQVELAVADAPAETDFSVTDAPVQQTDRVDFDAPSPDDPATSVLADASSVEPITDDVISTSTQPDLEPVTPPAEPEQRDRDLLVPEKPVFDNDALAPVFDMAPAVAQLPTPVASPHSSLVDEKPASRRVSQLSSSSSRRSSRASKTSSIILQGHHELVSTWVEKPDGTRVLQRRIVLHDSPTSAPATAPAIAPAAKPTNDAEPSPATPSPRSSMDQRRASTTMPNVINVMAATMPPTTFLSGYQSSMPYDTTISPFAPPMPRRGSSESTLTVAKAVDAPKYPKDPKSIHALPAHRREACSPLAPEADLQSYRGLMNVAALTLVVSNLRLIIENFLSWGLLLTLPRNWVGTQDWVVGAACIAFLGCVAAFSYSIEKTSATAGACFFVIESPMRRWALINLIAALVVPTCFVWFAVRDPVTGTAVMGLSVIVVLKLTSYHLVNAELRYFYNYGHNVPTYASSKSDDDRAVYPRNITVANLVEFLSFPTLCYQPKYPRTDRVRVGQVIKYALETAASIIIAYTLIEQYMRPIVESTYAALTDAATGDVHWTNASPVFLLERTLTLTLTTIYFWLTMFFGLFHAASNLQAELTRFADREFYLDWWNCSTIGAYWRLWNQPVHQWLKRHVYIPLVAGKWLPDPHHPPGALPDSPRGEIVGVSKQTAGLVCFFVSAVFHELLIAVPTKLVWMVGFGAMIVQVPLMAVSEKWDKKYRQWKPDGVNMLGNLLMWVTFCLIGHPTAVMLYYVGWCAREHCVVALA